MHRSAASRMSEGVNGTAEPAVPDELNLEAIQLLARLRLFGDMLRVARVDHADRDFFTRPRLVPEPDSFRSACCAMVKPGRIITEDDARDVLTSRRRRPAGIGAMLAYAKNNPVPNGTFVAMLADAFADESGYRRVPTFVAYGGRRELLLPRGDGPGGGFRLGATSQLITLPLTRPTLIK